MEHTESDPQRQTEQPAQTRLAYIAKDQRVLAWDGSTVAFCSNGSMAFRVASALRATEAMVDPEAAIREAREALEEWTQEPVDCASTRNPAPYPDCTCWACERTKRTRKALALLGGRPV